MKIKESRPVLGGSFGAGVWQETRVRELEDGEAQPKGAVPVPDDTQTHDWEREA